MTCSIYIYIYIINATRHMLNKNDIPQASVLLLVVIRSTSDKMTLSRALKQRRQGVSRRVLFQHCVLNHHSKQATQRAKLLNSNWFALPSLRRVDLSYCSTLLFPEGFKSCKQVICSRKTLYQVSFKSYIFSKQDDFIHVDFTYSGKSCGNESTRYGLS